MAQIFTVLIYINFTLHGLFGCCFYLIIYGRTLWLGGFITLQIMIIEYQKNSVSWIIMDFGVQKKLVDAGVSAFIVKIKFHAVFLTD